MRKAVKHLLETIRIERMGPVVMVTVMDSVTTTQIYLWS